MPEPNSILDWCDDLHQVRGNISQLQATLNQILAKAPSVGQYRELFRIYGEGSSETLPIHEKLKVALNSPQLQVAVRLKSLFDKGLLPFMLGMSRINFKSPKCDRFVGYLLDYCPPKQEVPNISIDDSKQIKSGLLGDSELYPPTLPPIDNKALARLAFTDKLLRLPADVLALQPENGTVHFNSSHNRKLALKGRYILDGALIDLLDSALPNAHEDDIEYLHFRLSAAHILAKFAYVYNFPEALVHQVPIDTPMDGKLAVFKNLFLAYVGALSQDNYSSKQINNWLLALYKPIVSTLEAEYRKTSQLKSKEAITWAEFKFMMARLNNYFLVPTRKIPFEFTIHEESPHVCQLEVGTMRLGMGSGATAQDAQKRAVYETFTDEPMRIQLLTYINEQIRLSREQTETKPKEEVSASEISSVATNGVESAEKVEEEKKPFNPPLGPKKLSPVNLAKAPLAPQNQPRMPLQYGMIPSSVPKVHKRK